MKKILFLLIILTFSPLWAAEYEFYGDLSLKGNSFHYDNGGLTFNPDPVNASDYLTGDVFSGQFILNGSHRLILDYGDFFIHHETGFNTHEVNGSKSELKPYLFNYIYEARANVYPNDFIQLRIGKQKVNWGMSYVFDPLDEINPFEMDREQLSGFYGINLIYTPTDLFSLMTVVKLDKSLETITGGDQNSWLDFVKGITGGLNASFLTGSVKTRLSFVYRYNEIYRPGLAFSLDALGMIFVAEGALEFHNGMMSYPTAAGIYNNDNLWEPRFLGEFAMERDFYLGDWSLSILGEYFYNGVGYTKAEADLFYADINSNPLSAEFYTAGMTLSGAEGFFLGQHYAMFSISLEKPYALSLSSSVIVNFNDRSFALDNSVKMFLLTDIDIYARFSVISGEKNHSEFGLSPENYLFETGITYYF
ncbi:MAG: hypothetical protein PF518_05425 [Spirochaetaceae bacterium]|jgi:hypothetical protein|nr:hypothetical protein [Spirochaetaceae bacterium]